MMKYQKYKLSELEPDTLYYDFDRFQYFYTPDCKRVINLTIDEADEEFGAKTPANIIEGISHG